MSQSFWGEVGYWGILLFFLIYCLKSRAYPILEKTLFIFIILYLFCPMPFQMPHNSLMTAIMINMLIVKVFTGEILGHNWIFWSNMSDTLQKMLNRYKGPSKLSGEYMTFAGLSTKSVSFSSVIFRQLRES